MQINLYICLNKNKIKMAKKKDSYVCSECLNEFPSKEIFAALVPNREYYTNYCKKCLIDLEIDKCKAYTSSTFKGPYILVKDIGTEKKVTKNKTTTKKTTKKIIK